MGLSAHELLLVLRARDEASRVLRGLSANIAGLDAQLVTAAHSQMAQGAALATVGVALAAVGIATLAALEDMTMASIKYTQSAALTQTQTDKVAMSLGDLKKMGLDVAQTMPVMFDQVQPALYDIFSSIETDAPGAKFLLEQIGVGAVAGAVNMSVAGRELIAVLNAWNMKAEDAGHVNDVLFQLVRKGVGTYEQFGTAIGKAIPSAVKASQSVEDLAGMMAFLTRNGLSAAMAATSAARALDAMSNPATVRKFAEIGIQITDNTTKLKPLGDAIKSAEVALGKLTQAEQVKALATIGVNAQTSAGKMRPMRDVLFEMDTKLASMSSGDQIKLFQSIGADAFTATGNIRPMSDMMEDLRTKMVGLSDAEKASMLKDLFGGSGGTLQAMRFFNLAVGEGGGLLQTLTGDMKNAEGAAKLAYDIMSNTPEAKLQELSNKFDAMKVTIGDILTPVVIDFVSKITGIIEKFNNLDPAVQRNIVLAIAFGAVLLTVVGIVTAIVGVVMMFQGLLVLLPIGMGALGGIVGGIVLGIAALVAIGVLLYQNWDKIKAVAASVWGWLVGAFNNIKDALNSVLGAGTPMGDFFIKMGAQIKELWDKLTAVTFPMFMNAVRNLGAAFMSLVNSPFVQFLIEVVKQVLIGIGYIVGAILMIAAAIAGSAIVGIINGLINGIVILFNGLVAFFTGIINIIGGVIDVIAGIFSGNLDQVGQGIVRIFGGIIQAVVGLFGGLVGGVIAFVVGLVQGVIGWFTALWNMLVGHSIVPDIVNGILTWFGSLPGKVVAFIVGLVVQAIAWFLSMKVSVIAHVTALIAAVSNYFGSIWGNISGGISSLVNNVVDWFRGLPGKITSALGNLGSLLLGAGSSIMSGFLSGLKSSWGRVTDFVGGIATWIRDNKGPKAYDLALLKPAGGWIMQGFAKSLDAGLSYVKSSLDATANYIADKSFGVGPVGFAGVPGTGGSASNTPQGNSGAYIPITVNTQEIDPVKHSADLGYEVARRLGL